MKKNLRINKGLGLGLSIVTAMSSTMPAFANTAVNAISFSTTVNATYTGGTTKTADTAVNIRSQASTNSSVIGSLQKGEVVTVTEVVQGWNKVTTSSGKVGYVDRRYLTDTPGATVATTTTTAPTTSTTTTTVSYQATANTDVNFRWGASNNSSVIRVIKKGEVVTVLEENVSGGWKKINVNGQTGYTFGTFLTTIATVAGTTTTAPSTSTTTTTTTTVTTPAPTTTTTTTDTTTTDVVPPRTISTEVTHPDFVIENGVPITVFDYSYANDENAEYGAGTYYYKTVYMDNVVTGYHGAGGDVVIPSGVTAIADNSPYDDIPSIFGNFNTVFGGDGEPNTSITSVVIPEGVVHIGQGAFYDCINLASVQLPNTLVTIGMPEGNFNGLSIEHFGAFQGCESLTSIVIPDSVTGIHDCAFGNTGLTSVTLSNNLEYIGTGALGSDNLGGNLTLPDSIKYIGSGAFNNIAVYHFDGVAKYYTTLDEVSLPYGVYLYGYNLNSTTPLDGWAYDGPAFYEGTKITYR